MKITPCSIVAYSIMLLISFNVFAESAPYCSYYHITNKAEQYILKSKSDSALIFYREAFELDKIPFPKDLYNAGICAAIHAHYTEATAFFQKLVERYGYKIEKFQFKTEKVREILKSLEWENFLKEFDTYYSTFEKSLDLEFIQTIDNIFYSENFSSWDERDKDNVIYNNTKLLYNSIPQRKADFFRYAYTNKVKFMVIAGHYFILRNKIKKFPEKYSSLFYQSMKMDDYPLDDLYLSAVKEHLLHPLDYEIIIDINGTKEHKPSIKLDFDSLKATISFPPNINKVNENKRLAELCLPNMDDMVKTNRSVAFYLYNYPFEEMLSLLKLYCTDEKQSLSGSQFMDEYTKKRHALEEQVEKSYVNKYYLSDFNIGSSFIPVHYVGKPIKCLDLMGKLLDMDGHSHQFLDSIQRER